jgi:GntR family transcriptional regulator
VQRTAYDKEGHPVEHSFDYFRPDRMRITLRTQADAAPRAEIEAPEHLAGQELTANS